MPLYEYWCRNCGNARQEFRRVVERDSTPYCWRCYEGQARFAMVRALAAPHLHGSPNMPNG